ncbi:MAG TPA: ATP-binding protein [Bacteroidia bacterium]|nr:ATP-binding protein [Bacteroidia bacterium]HNT79803.1 ATP-binding protein [Bacteroidia bacterium]
MSKFAILGPESTGKTVLAEALSKYLNAQLVPEYAREYLTHFNRPYTVNDLENITAKQIELMSTLLKKNEQIIFDTELINLQVWFELKFEFSPLYLNKAIQSLRPDFYLLTYPDIEWHSDPLRENQFNREHLFDLYKEKLCHYSFDYGIVKGKGEERLNSAIKQIENFAGL